MCCNVTKYLCPKFDIDDVKTFKLEMFQYLGQSEALVMLSMATNV